MALAPIEPELVAAARRGEPQGRERLFREAYPRLYRYQLRLVAGDEEAAHELAQETMLRVLRSLPELRDTERFIPWMLRIAVNVWRDEQRRRRTVPLSEDREAPSDGRSETSLSLEAVPEPYRSALTLRYLEGLDYEAMSEILAVPAATLRSHVARGLRMIRKGVRHESL